MQPYDVIVIGAGAMGSATAWWLARRGRQVLLLERFEAGHHRGSSHGATRIFRLAYPDPEYVRMAQASASLWQELEDDASRPLLDVTGGVDHGPSQELEVVAAALEAAGAAHEMLSPEAASERWPGMHFDGLVLHHPGAGRVRADVAVTALQERAAAHGAVVRFGEGADGLAVNGDQVTVRTSGGDAVTAPVAVVTAGPWAPTFLQSLLQLPPMRVTREQIFHFAPRTGPWPSFIHHRQPFMYGLESPDEGVKVAEHHSGPVTHPDHRSFSIDAAGMARVRRYVEAWFPGLEPEPAHPATCLYTTTPTEDFVLDRVGPVVVGAGFSGHGFKFTPLIGRVLADLADGLPGPGSRFALGR